MDTRQIQAMRALLATLDVPKEGGRPTRARKLPRFLSRWSPLLLTADLEADIGAEPDPQASLNSDEDDDTPLLLIERRAKPRDPIPPEILLGDLSPRRPSFGQRRETMLDLDEPAPPEARRLILLAADGAAVGEIVLHASDMETRNAKLWPQAVLPSETPYFPEDLVDDPRIHPQSRPRRSFGKAAPRPTGSPPRELAAMFLLADLAARLAREEAALRDRLWSVKTRFQAA